MNELPLSLMLSWYEQKAVADPADAACTWASRTSAWGRACRHSSRRAVLQILVEKFNIAPITTPEADLAAILGAGG